MMKAFLLAAGLGTRMGAITRDTPKCLLPIGGRPLLGRWFDLLAHHGVDAVLVNTHHLAESVRDFVATAKPPLSVVLAHEAELLGSGGTLAANRDFVCGEDAFLVIYADNASRVDLRALVRAHRPGDAATLGLFRVRDPSACGVVEIDAAGRVLDFVEKPQQPRSNLAWAGLLVGTPDLLDAIPERRPCDLGRDVIPGLRGRMRAIEIDGYHLDIGTPESYRRTCADFERMERTE
jgi:mannose-1-phosphate guanylyltransferase